MTPPVAFFISLISFMIIAFSPRVPSQCFGQPQHCQMPLSLSLNLCLVSAIVLLYTQLLRHELAIVRSKSRCSSTLPMLHRNHNIYIAFSISLGGGIHPDRYLGGWTVRGTSVLTASASIICWWAFAHAWASARNKQRHVVLGVS